MQIYFVAGHSYAISHIVFCAVGALTCLAAYLLSRELFSENIALLTAAALSIYIPHVYLCTIYLSEALFSLLLTLAIWIFLVTLRRKSSVLTFISGFAIGIAALTRPVAILAVPGLALISLWASRWSLLRPLLFGIGVFAAVAPWTIRNKQVHDEWVLITTNGGSTFYGSNNDVVLRNPHELGYWVTTRRLPGRELVDAAPNEVAHDRVEFQLGYNWIYDNLVWMPLLLTFKILRLVLPDFHSNNYMFVLMNIVTYTPFFILMITGAMCCIRNWKHFGTPHWWAVHATVLATTVVNSLIFYGCGRFLNAVAPLLMVYASLGVVGVKAAAQGGENRGTQRR